MQGVCIERNVRLPKAIWEWIDVVLFEARDKIEEEENGDYLLVFEGWGDHCVEPVWDDVRPIDENESAAREYAEQQSGKRIDEWMGLYRRTRRRVAYGHISYPMHGVTWALFKTKVKTRGRAGCRPGQR